ncbi:hypothetical protein [Acinetobacter calcoaceticus]|uniref:hypothetical protein n=1 Tax=Acinetobacter calcoaceticus TaxID=471 RepID=UPI00285EDE66|nr:hypothetical protein [Acinetobacter calcoaceticus]MDR6796844.1 hypothetical protein [Acinetobacter calcoaceticus]
MDQSDLCSLGHVTNFFKFDKQNCVAHYRDPALTIPVNSSEYSIATYYADFRGRSKSEINKISPDFLEQVSKKELCVFKLEEMLKGVVRLNQNNSFMSIPPILDPKNRILKNCPILFTKKDIEEGQEEFFYQVYRATAAIIVSSLKKQGNLDNALIGIYSIEYEAKIKGLVIIRLLDLEHYNGNSKQILNINKMLPLKSFKDFNPESSRWPNFLL